MSKQEQIMKLLERGKIIRLMDGRCGDSFVDMPALTALIQQKRVKVYDNKGVDFVRAYTCEELLALEAAKVANYRARELVIKKLACDTAGDPAELLSRIAHLFDEVKQ